MTVDPVDEQPRYPVDVSCRKCHQSIHYVVTEDGVLTPEGAFRVTFLAIREDADAADTCTCAGKQPNHFFQMLNGQAAIRRYLQLAGYAK